MENSNIPWCNHSQNFWIGCRRVSLACRQCYMFREQAQYGGEGANIRRTGAATWSKPSSWNEAAADHSKPTFVFASSWTDFFLPDADPWRAEAWEVIRQTRHLTWLILTKRTKRIPDCLPSDWGRGYANVLLGATIEHPHYLYRLDELQRVPCQAGTFLSLEPLLGPVDLPAGKLNNIRAVFAGGQTGQPILVNPTDIAWARAARDTCKTAQIPFMWKGWGCWIPITQANHPNSRAPYQGRLTRSTPTREAYDATYAALGKLCGDLLDYTRHDGMPYLLRG